MIIGICCVDKNWGLGKANSLLFNLKKDMQFFKQTTADSIVVCGLNTLLSFPGSKPLKGRSTIVICPEGYDRDDCFCVHSFEDLIKLITELSKTQNVFIIGGGMLYQSMLPYYDEVFVTKVDADGDAEVFFPNLDLQPSFRVASETAEVEDGDYKIKFLTYKGKQVVGQWRAQ